MISEEERINLLSECKDIDCICQDCMYLQFVKNNILSVLQQENQSLKEEKKRLLEIAKKMHLYIFLNTTDEQKAYDEIGLTDEENAMLGYSGEFILKGDK